MHVLDISNLYNLIVKKVVHKSTLQQISIPINIRVENLVVIFNQSRYTFYS